MPTKNPRTNITHTPQVQHALSVARKRWPAESTDSGLILHLLEEGAKAIEASAEYNAQQRRDRIRELAGKHSDAYGSGYLEDVRAGWSE